MEGDLMQARSSRLKAFHYCYTYAGTNQNMAQYQEEKFY